MSSRSSTPLRTPSPATMTKISQIWRAFLRDWGRTLVQFTIFQVLILLIGSLIIGLMYKSVPYCDGAPTRMFCRPCPDNAECSGREYTCHEDTFRFQRICAKPGVVIRSYDQDSQRHYAELQKTLYDIVVAKKEPTVAEVLETLAMSDDAELRKLDANDVRNIWTYDSRYSIDKQGVMGMHSRYDFVFSRPGISEMIGLMLAGCFVFCILVWAWYFVSSMVWGRASRGAKRKVN